MALQNEIRSVAPYAASAISVGLRFNPLIFFEDYFRSAEFLYFTPFISTTNFTACLDPAPIEVCFGE